MADGDGFIYKPNVNVMEEMADMIFCIAFLSNERSGG